MAKFTVLFEQWVQEITKIEVEADTAEEAWAKAQQQEDADELDLDWSDGNDVDYRGAVEIQDAAGTTITLKVADL